MTDSGCFNCEANGRLGSLPVRELILCEGGWRAAHAFDSSLPGWLVLVPVRHVTRLDELTPEEASSMGALLVRLSQALRDVADCEKTYVMLFAEAQGFEHLHFHVVPRMRDFDDHQIGPQVFSFLGRPDGERLSDDSRDRMATDIQAALSRP